MTNCGMVLPDAGYHEALRRLTRTHGTLLCIDETHTISSGPGGYTATHALEPDFFVLGKPIAGGIPAAVYGWTDAVDQRIKAYLETENPAIAALARRCRAMRCNSPPCASVLEQILTDEVYAAALPLAQDLETASRL